MKRISLLIIALLATTVTAFAQQKGKVTFTLVDSATKQGVIGAVVSIAPVANLDDAKHGVTGVACWQNTAAFQNLPINNGDGNGVCFTFKFGVTNFPLSIIQFFIHSAISGTCYFRCCSNYTWSNWKQL